MTNEEKLRQVKALREKQRLIRFRVAKIRSYPQPTTTRRAINRAMLIISYLEQYEKTVQEITRIAKTPAYKPGKHSIFITSVSTILETGEAFIK